MLRSLLTSLGLLVLRVSVGGMMLIHGWQKYEMFQKEMKFADPLGIGQQASLGLALFAELICAGLVILGLLTRLATIPLIGAMSVALFLYHKADPWQTKELAAVYLAVFSSLLLTGPGSFSIDRLLFRPGKPKKSESKSK